ncbi:MAG: SWF/SNF helicase family protein, partial [Actinomycetia bacterium]|nr:SWF/SNF helicase family protein [Actinomycetes bacterium]
QAYQLSNAGLLRSSLLKRLESSPLALANTLGRLIKSHVAFLDALDSGWVLAGEALREWTSSDAADFEEFLGDLDDVKTTQADKTSGYHLIEMQRDVTGDLELLRQLKVLADDAAAEDTDLKAIRLIDRLREIAAEAAVPSRSGVSASDRCKAIVFSTFADTIDDVHRRVVDYINNAGDDDPVAAYRGRVAPAVYGSRSGTDQDARSRTLAWFAPKTAGVGSGDDRYDLLLTTDVLSEGVNLQQAGHIINYDLPWNPMRIVQRHGRIDRIGSEHARIFLDCFFPAEHLDQLLHLEERLHRKLAQADAAVGTGQVLPGFDAGEGQVFADTRDDIAKLYNEDGSILDAPHGALSGEEYRQRLRKATGTDENTELIERLPYGSGSGFINPRITQPGYVFCIRITGQGKARFRFVPSDTQWKPLHIVTDDGTEAPIVVDDTLTALIAADPVTQHTPRDLPAVAYKGAFDAWEIAKRNVYEEWQHLADGTALLPDVPKALRDTAQLMYGNEAALNSEEQEELLERLNTNPPVRVQREIRQILNGDEPVDTQLGLVLETLQAAGIEPATPPPDLSAIEEHDIRLVAWMAVGSMGAPEVPIRD